MNASSILCVHPNGELYGSDRVFLQSVRALAERWPDATITVLLPFEGPLSGEMRKLVADVRIEPIYVLRRSELGVRFVLRLPRLLARVARARRLMAGRDICYVSTIVAADFLLASRLRRCPILVHVHELPTGPARLVFSAMLSLANAVLIHISAAVRDGFVGLGAKQAVVVPNGVPAMADASPPTAQERLRLLLIGRYNAWKGQTLLLDALAALPADARARVSVRLVGSVYADQTHFLEAIRERITRHRLEQVVAVLPFDPDPTRHYRWADVVVVPSILPEPFGLVATEAMAAARPVIAANHGGLAEIVVDGATGILFPPGDAVALATAVRAYLEAPARRSADGLRGQERFASNYSEQIFRRRFAAAAKAMVERTGAC